MKIIKDKENYKEKQYKNRMYQNMLIRKSC